MIASGNRNAKENIMAAFAEILPATKSSPNASIRWIPSQPGRGMLEIAQKRNVTRYAVCEYQTPWAGRAVAMTKADDAPGSDDSMASYDVFCGEDGEQICDCKGFTAHGHCKHAAALDALIGNGWINHSAPVEDAEVDTVLETEFVPAGEPIPGFWEWLETLPWESTAMENNLGEQEAVEEPLPTRMVWCMNYRTCGGINVPGCEVPGTGDQVCLICKAAIDLAK